LRKGNDDNNRIEILISKDELRRINLNNYTDVTKEMKERGNYIG